LVNHVSVTNSFTYNVVGATAITFTSVEVKVSAESLADGNIPILFLALDATLATRVWDIGLSQAAGVASIEAHIYYDGSTHTVWSETLALDKLYRFEIKWDTTNDRWSLWVNGVLYGDGALTGGAATTLMGSLVLGCAGDVGAYTVRLDRIEVDNSDHIGPDALPPVIDYSKFPIEKLAAGPRRLLA
jgi:hypothetical protein